MKGVVAMYNVPANIGFIAGDDGVEYFVHASNITPPVDGFAVLLTGWQVEFTPGNGKEGPEAFSVIPPSETWGLHVVKEPKAVQLPKGGIAKLQWVVGVVAGPDGGMGTTVGVNLIHPLRNEAVEPSLQSSTFSAYYVGPQKVGGFVVEASSPDVSRIFLVLDKDKGVERALEEEPVEIGPRSYVLMVAASGFVTVWTVGYVHRYDRRNHNWVVVQVRFRHQYDLSEGAPSLEEQTLEPAADGRTKKRNNAQFVPTIASCLKALRAHQTESEQ